MGEIHYLLGIEVIRDRRQRTIRLGQQKYIDDVLQRFNMTGAAGVSHAQLAGPPGAIPFGPMAGPRFGFVAPQYAAPPASWSYDPYTSGLTPCVNREPSDPPCSELVAPSFGQPNYRAR